MAADKTAFVGVKVTPGTKRLLEGLALQEGVGVSTVGNRLLEQGVTEAIAWRGGPLRVALAGLRRQLTALQGRTLTPDEQAQLTQIAPELSSLLGTRAEWDALRAAPTVRCRSPTAGARSGIARQARARTAWGASCVTECAKQCGFWQRVDGHSPAVPLLAIAAPVDTTGAPWEIPKVSSRNEVFRVEHAR
jgi:hypothetical protein